MLIVYVAIDILYVDVDQRRQDNWPLASF